MRLTGSPSAEYLGRRFPSYFYINRSGGSPSSILSTTYTCLGITKLTKSILSLDGTEMGLPSLEKLVLNPQSLRGIDKVAG
jgi:hypothetical protein